MDMSPSSGSPTMGSMEVMGRGRASVIQYLASEMLSSSSYPARFPYMAISRIM